MNRIRFFVPSDTDTVIADSIHPKPIRFAGSANNNSFGNVNTGLTVRRAHRTAIGCIQICAYRAFAGAVVIHERSVVTGADHSCSDVYQMRIIVATGAAKPSACSAGIAMNALPVDWLGVFRAVCTLTIYLEGRWSAWAYRTLRGHKKCYCPQGIGEAAVTAIFIARTALWAFGALVYYAVVVVRRGGPYG